MNNIALLRKQFGLSQKEFGKKVGVAQNTICNWEKGNREPDNESLKRMSELFNVSIDYILGREEQPRQRVAVPKAENIMPLPKTKKIPLIGTIACGEPIYADENIEEYLTVPEDIDADFCLRCKGDSMIGARIHNGDIVYIRSQEVVDNGQIAAVLIDDEATLKRVYIENGTVSLVAANDSYAPMFFTGPDTERVRILGRAVAFLSRVR